MKASMVSIVARTLDGRNKQRGLLTSNDEEVYKATVELLKTVGLDNLKQLTIEMNEEE